MPRYYLEKFKSVFSKQKVTMGCSIKMEDFEDFQLQSLFAKVGIKIMSELNKPMYPE